MCTGQMDKVQFKWFDSEYHDGECANEKGKVPTSGKKLISFRSNQLLCFHDCQKERWQPRWEKEENLRSLKLPYLRGCEYDSKNKTCFSHTSETLTKGNNKPNSKCMLFLTLAQEPGKCIYYNWINSRVPFASKYKKEYPDIYEPEECLKKCLRQYHSYLKLKPNLVQQRPVENDLEDVVGCEFRRTKAGDPTCAAITSKFEGGSRQPDPEGSLNVCWKIQEKLPEKTIHSSIRDG